MGSQQGYPRQLDAMSLTRRRVLHVSSTTLVGLACASSWSAAGALQEGTPIASPDAEFTTLFDGTADSFANWAVTGGGGFELVDGVIEARAADDLGLLYYTPRPFADFILRLEFRITEPDDNSGVFVRFSDPSTLSDGGLLATPEAAVAYPNLDLYASNGSWVAIDTGFEIQIDEAALGNPMDDSDDGQPQFRTGALYDIPVGQGEAEQAFLPGPEVIPGEWHTLEIEVVGNTFTVRLDGEQTTSFTNRNALRGKSANDDPLSGYIGLQSHPFTAGHVDFRNIRIRELTS